jgi:hypothetical protein
MFDTKRAYRSVLYQFPHSDGAVSVNFTVGFLGACGPGSVVGIATGYGLDGPVIESRWGARFSAPVQTGPGAHPALYNGYRVFPGVKSGRGVTLTPHLLLVLWSRRGRAIPLLPLWAARPVQSPTACKRVHFTFTCLGAWFSVSPRKTYTWGWVRIPLIL